MLNHSPDGLVTATRQHRPDSYAGQRPLCFTAVV